MKGSREAIGPEGLNFEEIVAQGILLLIAGSETTATLLSGMLYYLVTNPSKLTRLTNEIRSSFNTEQEIDVRRVFNLPYLHGVLEESLRMHPPVPGVFPRTTPEEGALICGKFVPGGTSVGMNHYASYHSANHFFDPDAFHPKRWLEGADSQFVNDNKSVFHPFSHGPRNCLGKK